MVLPKLSMVIPVSTSFDLWMSSGCGYICELIVHGVDRDFRQSQVHLALIQCNRKDYLFELLTGQLKKFGLTGNIFACVRDGGSYLRSCTNNIRSSPTFKHADIRICFSGVCFAQIISGACNAALSKSATEGLPLIDLAKYEHRCKNAWRGLKSLRKVGNSGLMHDST